MSRTLNFTATATVVLTGTGPGTGTGTASTGPTGTRESWTPETASVSCSTNDAEATASIYQDQAFIDATTWGSTGDSTSNFTSAVYPGSVLSATWAGGDPGATATLVIRGTRQVP